MPEVAHIPEPFTITLEGSSKELPKVKCTCGWSYGPSTKLLELGIAAKTHAQETGHAMRQHSEE